MTDSLAMDLTVTVNGELLVLDPSGALWWPHGRTLVFADLHLEKGSSYARGGQFLPPYDTRATLARMNDVIARRDPVRIVALGDSFHDRHASERLPAVERAHLSTLTARMEWVWIAGNHDPLPPADLAGRIADECALGALVLRHEPAPAPAAGEVAGHLHPCARVAKWGRSVRRRCFVSDGTRLVMPSFGAYTGGLDSCEAPVASLFPQGFHAYMIGRDRVYAAARFTAQMLRRRNSRDDSQPIATAINTALTP